MHGDYFIASTYFDLTLRQFPELQKVVTELFGERGQQLANQAYIDGNDVTALFTYLSENGVDSWLLKYGASTAITAHGALSFAVLSAPDLNTALHTLIKYQTLRLSSHTSHFETHANDAAIIIDENIDRALVSRWLLETTLQVIIDVIENIIAQPLHQHTGEPVRIEFKCAAPSYAEQLQAFYRIDCHYQQARNALVFPASWGQTRSPLYDETSFRNALTQCQALKLRLAETDYARSVKLRIKRALNDRIDAQYTTSQLPSLSMLATRFAMSPRTLNRVLKKHHTSYKECLASVRFELATHLLENTSMSIAAIADKLAYREPANFVRAFKQWAGCTPSAWRKRSHHVN